MENVPFHVVKIKIMKPFLQEMKNDFRLYILIKNNLKSFIPHEWSLTSLSEKIGVFVIGERISDDDLDGKMWDSLHRD